MGMLTTYPDLESRFAVPFEKRDPAANLFDHIVQRFGKNCQNITVRRNSLLCCQGAKLESLYLVREGEILLTRVTADGRETLLSVLGPGELFGESALLSDTAVTFSANATKRSVVSLIPARKFRLLIDDPDICRCLLETIARRCDDAWTQMEVIGCTHVRDKVRTGLLWLADRIGVRTSEGVRINLNQTRLARMIGCARETLSREVGELRRNRVVDVLYTDGRKSFYVVDPKGLAQSL